jgi:hypothetical protein
VIRATFEPHPLGLAPIPRLAVGVFIPALSGHWVVISFIIDTGADKTALGPTDAFARVGISWPVLTQPSLWARQVSVGGIGGEAIHYIEDAYYQFRHEDGREQMIAHEIAILKPHLVPGSPGSSQTVWANAGVPSLLGRDLLRYFRLTVDGPNQTITLE